MTPIIDGGCSQWQFQTQPTGVNAQQGPTPYPPPQRPSPHSPPHLGPPRQAGSPHLGPPHPGPKCHPPHPGPLCHPRPACRPPDPPPCPANVCIGINKATATAQMRVSLPTIELASQHIQQFAKLDLSQAICLSAMGAHILGCGKRVCFTPESRRLCRFVSLWRQHT